MGIENCYTARVLRPKPHRTTDSASSSHPESIFTCAPEDPTLVIISECTLDGLLDDYVYEFEEHGIEDEEERRYMRKKLSEALVEMFFVPAGVCKADRMGEDGDKSEEEFDEKSQDEEEEDVESESKKIAFREVEIRDVGMSGDKEDGEISDEDFAQVSFFYNSITL